MMAFAKGMTTKILVGSACIVVGALGTYALVPTESLAQGKAERTFELDIDFDQFRQLMVRTDATAAIVEHGGMKLLDEKVESVEIGFANDHHPLRNALMGRSKADVVARKSLTVQLDDPQLNATEVHLVQDSEIHPGILSVTTSSTEPSGRLHAYTTTLNATEKDDRTVIRVSVDMTVGLRISPLFHFRAADRIEEESKQAIEEQESAIRSLVSASKEGTSYIPVSLH